jgi:hypothetical protein
MVSFISDPTLNKLLWQGDAYSGQEELVLFLNVWILNDLICYSFFQTKQSLYSSNLSSSITE